LFFGAAHLTGILWGTTWNDAFPHIIACTLMGFGYAAVYLYLKNLLACILLHTVYDIALHLSNGLIAQHAVGSFETVISVMCIAFAYVLFQYLQLF